MSEQRLAIGIHGAHGRMGTRLIQLIYEDPELQLGAALERAGHPHLGEDAGSLAGTAPQGVALSPTVPADVPLDVMVDFSLPSAALELIEVCVSRRIPVVVGTTGFDARQREALQAAARQVAILVAPNMSRAVNLLMRLVGEAARALGADADIEVIERHHRTKRDAPSGTALRLAEIAGRGVAAGRLISGGRESAGVRAPGEVGIHSLRTGDSPGDHTVIFGLLGETLELTHRAINRDGFARGALQTAKFLAGKPPGCYSMEDVLS